MITGLLEYNKIHIDMQVGLVQVGPSIILQILLGVTALESKMQVLVKKKKKETSRIK